MTQEQAEEKTVHPHGFISKELKQAVYQDERKTPSFSYGDISDNSQYVKD